MKKSTLTINLLIFTLLLGNTIFAQVRDTLSLGTSYSNDLFYSFENGEVATAERTNWDIAFYTPRFSAGIMTNDGSGVMLYTYPYGDTSAWASVDTTGMTAWPALYNSTQNWEDGAFNQNATIHPDYGWGWYNQTDHSVYGDSIYIIDLQGTGLKKLWIKKKVSIDNIYIFQYADLDGSNLQEVELDVVPYESKNFIYYSLSTNQAIDREPAGQSWDILFTKWTDQVDNGEGGTSPYIVTGVLSNVDIAANHFYPVAPDFTDWYSMPLDTVKNKIGYDWKSLNFVDFTWDIADSNYYFVQTYAGDIYKLGFVWWQGSMTGDFALDKELVSLVSVDETSFDKIELQVYPNPAADQFTLKSDSELKNNCSVIINDQAGRSVYQKALSAGEVNNGFVVKNLNLTKGLYIISISNNEFSASQKLLVK